MKYLFTIKCNSNNTYIDTLINDLIDTSLLFNIEIEFNILKDKNYNKNKIDITPYFYSNDKERIPQNYLDFHCYYLDNYLENTDLNFSLLNVK